MAFTTIDKSTDYFDTKLWTGNDTAQTITGIPFAPDFVWIKNRSAAESHTLVNTPIGANNFLKSNATSANNTNSEFLKSFTSDGYTLGNADEVNNGSNNIVGWNWKAGTTSGIATNGSTQITPSSYSFNQTSGFSIVKYTGIGGQPKAIAHGLGVQPKMFIIKRSDSTGSWGVLPQQISTGHLYLDATTALGTVNPLSGGVLADTVNFSVSNSGDVNASGGTYVAYCFADVQGFSKMGSYTGNGNNDGAFVYTGFKPAWIMFKRTDSAESWIMADNKRDTDNSVIKYLEANTANAEGSGVDYDFLSNGFKFRTTSQNTGGATYIYMAFAEAPLVGTNNVPATAR